MVRPTTVHPTVREVDGVVLRKMDSEVVVAVRLLLLNRASMPFLRPQVWMLEVVVDVVVVHGVLLEDEVRREAEAALHRLRCNLLREGDDGVGIF